MKVTLEFAQDHGLIPKVDCFQQTFFGDKYVTNEENIKRLNVIRRKYNVDNNDLVDIDISDKNIL
jgi:hypothetical protein